MTNAKTYWSLLKTCYNEEKVPITPLLLIDNKAHSSHLPPSSTYVLGVGISTLGGGDFFQVRLENSLYQKLWTQISNKKMILIVISTIHFWSSNLTISW